jgi:hypothetical protein
MLVELQGTWYVFSQHSTWFKKEGSLMRRLIKLLGVTTLAVMIFVPTLSLAQNSNGPSVGTDTIDAKGVGVSGGVFLGGELIVAVEAIIGVDKLWPYLTFPILGAAGGGIGGYFVEQTSPEGAVAMLVAGLVLLVPAAIAASSALAYDPDEEGALTEDDEGGTYGFESNNIDLSTKPEAESSTEVEARPEGAPSNAPPPPRLEGPPGEAAPEPEVAPEPTEPAATGDDSAHLYTPGATRRPTPIIGSLFNVSRNGDATFAIPLVDVRPTNMMTADQGNAIRSGIEVFVPVLHVDLP